MYLGLPYMLLAIMCAGLAADTPAKSAPGAVDGVGQSTRPLKRTGDQITLKSGKVLHGVKIVRQTSVNLVLEVIPGVEPLVIPAKQVASIKYGTLGPRYDLPPTPPASEREEPVDVVPAVKTSPALIRRLALPFTDEAMEYADQDLLNILRSLSILSGVPIQIDPALAEIAPEKRQVTLHLPAGTSMDTFLKDLLPECAPWLVVNFDFNAIRFALREVPDVALEHAGRPVPEKKPGGESTGHP